jgi:hypothetical protein
MASHGVRQVGRLTAAALLAVATLLPAAAFAQTQRLMVEGGAEAVSPTLADRLDAWAAEGLDLVVHILAADSAEGAEEAAARITDDRGGVALVVTPGEIGAFSVGTSDDVPGALDALFAALDRGGDLESGVVAFAEHLKARRMAGGPPAGGTQTPSTLPASLVDLGLLGGFIFLLTRMRRSSRQSNVYAADVMKEGEAVDVPGGGSGVRSYGSGASRSRRVAGGSGSGGSFGRSGSVGGGGGTSRGGSGASRGR